MEVDIKLDASNGAAASNVVRLTGRSEGVLNHVYNHIVGLASPSGYNPAAMKPEDGFSSFSNDGKVAPALPVTSPFSRPKASLLFAVEGLGSTTQELPAPLEGSRRYQTDLSPGFNHLLSRSAARRGGLSRQSLDVVHPQAELGGGVQGPAIRWTSAAGFVPASAHAKSTRAKAAPQEVSFTQPIAGDGDSWAASIDQSFLGVLACKEEGKKALESLGLKVSGRGTGAGCPTYSFSFSNGALQGSGNWQPQETVTLDAGKSGSLSQGLSEAALAVILGDKTAALYTQETTSTPRLERAPGVLMHRAYLTGLEQAAEEFGTASGEYRALDAALRKAINKADETVRSAVGQDSVATAVFGLAPGVFTGEHGKSHGHAAVAGPRFLTVVQNGTTYYQQSDIADSQLFLWTWIGLLGVAVASVWFIGSVNPDEESDPALFGAEVSGGGSGGAHHRAN